MINRDNYITLFGFLIGKRCKTLKGFLTILLEIEANYYLLSIGGGGTKNRLIPTHCKRSLNRAKAELDIKDDYLIHYSPDKSCFGTLLSNITNEICHELDDLYCEKDDDNSQCIVRETFGFCRHVYVFVISY